jgi:hypothetical protein
MEDLKQKFPKTVRAWLTDGGDGEIYVEYDDGPRGSGVSESPRLVATYRLVRVETLVKRTRVEVVKTRRRKKS